MKVRKLLVTDIRCRTCNVGPGESCDVRFAANLLPYGLSSPGGGILLAAHGERIAEHAELERAGWDMWQEVDPTDRGDGREARERNRRGEG